MSARKVHGSIGKKDGLNFRLHCHRWQDVCLEQGIADVQSRRAVMNIRLPSRNIWLLGVGLNSDHYYFYNFVSLAAFFLLHI